MDVEKLELQYFNPIKQAEDTLSISKMPLNRLRLNTLTPYKDDKDIYEILNRILRDIDLSKTVFGMLKCTTDSVMYKSSLSEYVYYVEHSSNHLKWNELLDKLVVQHCNNLIFEKEFVPPTLSKEKGKKKKVEKKPKNMYYRRETIDLFTEEHIFEYINPRTGDIIKSTDPNLCDKLNAEIEKLESVNKPKRKRGERRERIERAKVIRTPDFSKMKFKF